MQIKILNIEPYEYSLEAIKEYRSVGQYIEISKGQSLDSIHKKDIQVLLIRLENVIDAQFLKEFHSLKYVVTPTTGLDHIDLDYCAKKGIEIISLREHKDFLKKITSTPELTWGILMALIRKITFANQSVLDGNWNRDEFRGIQLSGKSIGIIGFGRTGIQMAKYAEAFGMNVYYFDPYVQENAYTKVDSLESLLSISDVITLHVHLSSSTEYMINDSNIKFLKKGAVLINSSRGDIVQESALVSALSSGLLAGVATDVLSNELVNFQESPLFKAALNGANVVITPHIGGATFDAMHMCEEHLAKLVARIYSQPNLI